MSIKSSNAKERLFNYSTSIKHNGNTYNESFYYLIDSIDSDQYGNLRKVTVNIIIDIEAYLNGTVHEKVNYIFIDEIPDSVRKSADDFKKISL